MWPRSWRYSIFVDREATITLFRLIKLLLLKKTDIICGLTGCFCGAPHLQMYKAEHHSYWWYEWWYSLLKMSYKASISLIAAPLWILLGTKAQMCHAWEPGLYLYTWVTLAWNRMILIIDYMLFFCFVFYCFRACPHLLCIISRQSGCGCVFALETRRCYFHKGGIFFNVHRVSKYTESFNKYWFYKILMSRRVEIYIIAMLGFFLPCNYVNI